MGFPGSWIRAWQGASSCPGFVCTAPSTAEQKSCPQAEALWLSNATISIWYQVDGEKKEPRSYHLSEFDGGARKGLQVQEITITWAGSRRQPVWDRIYFGKRSELLRDVFAWAKFITSVFVFFLYFLFLFCFVSFCFQNSSTLEGGARRSELKKVDLKKVEMPDPDKINLKQN